MEAPGKFLTSEEREAEEKLMKKMKIRALSESPLAFFDAFVDTDRFTLFREVTGTDCPCGNKPVFLVLDNVLKRELCLTIGENWGPDAIEVLEVEQIDYLLSFRDCVLYAPILGYYSSATTIDDFEPIVFSTYFLTRIYEPLQLPEHLPLLRECVIRMKNENLVQEDVELRNFMYDPELEIVVPIDYFSIVKNSSTTLEEIWDKFAEIGVFF
jgi:hypothetical protein